MTTTTFKTSGMHCPSCSMLIEMDVADLPGVDSVSASHADGTTRVSYDESVVDAQAIVKAIKHAGYDAQVLS